MAEEDKNLIKIEKSDDIITFIEESFIYDNLFNLKIGKFNFTGILYKLDIDQKLLIIRLPENATEKFLVNNTYELRFNNSRGKFHTKVMLADTLLKAGRTYLSFQFPSYLLRLQRRKSLRVVTDMNQNPVIATFIKGKENIDLQIKEIGLGGFSVSLASINPLMHINIGEIIHIKLFFRELRIFYSTKVRVRHSSNVLSRNKIGFEFLTISEQFKKNLSTYMLHRRHEIKNRIFKKNSESDRNKHEESIGEWLESIIQYEKAKFSRLKIAFLTDSEETKEKFSFLKDKFPMLQFFKFQDIEIYKKFSPNIVIFDLTSGNHSYWYKLTKEKFLKFTPFILISKDESISHLLKSKNFMAKAVTDRNIDNIENDILLFSNPLVPEKKTYKSLANKPYSPLTDFKILTIDNSSFNFSINLLFNGLGFDTDTIEEFDSNALSGYDLIVYNITENIKNDLQNIFRILQEELKLLITLDKSIENSEKIIKLFSNEITLLKPFKFDQLLKKTFEIIKKDTYDYMFEKIKLHVLTNEKERLKTFIKTSLKDSVLKDLFLFDFPNVNDFSPRDKTVLVDLHLGAISNNSLSKYIENHTKISRAVFIGFIYRKMDKKLLMKYMNAGVKKICMPNNLYKELKNYFIFS